MVTVKHGFTDAQSWLEIQKSHFTSKELADFKLALDLAHKYYQDHKFYPVDVPLFNHALTCANTVAELHLYSDAVLAAMLFALPKFCPDWQEEMQVFDPKVTELIDGVNRVSQIRRIGTLADVENESEKKEQIEVIRKMLLAMASDIRVVLIVLVGRGELMLNLKSCKDEQIQKKIALETLEIYAPLANRLGMWQIKWELEDLSFKYTHPDQYKKIAHLLDETREERLDYIEQIKDFLSHQMEQGGITDYQITGRAKHIFSIWKKMKKKNYDFDDLYDIRAVRVLVPEVKDCYTVLGIVHTKYSPIPGEFDDYISNPKPNNYQSLHTCVVGPDNKVVEIQIRTFAMHDHAEYGVAAHWRYKETGDKGSENSQAFAEKVAWLRHLLDWRDELTERKDITDAFKNEIFNDTIYVMTPNGKVIALPKGSTPIDFAYALHSSLGDRCRGAKVDGQIVPLATPLQNGQRVEVLTVKDGGPSVNWLHDGWVRSSKAISSIRRYIRNQNNEEFYEAGIELFERELAKFPASIRPEPSSVITKLNYDNEKELCIDLGRGDIGITRLQEAITNLVEREEMAQGSAAQISIADEIAKLDFTKAPLKGYSQKGLSGILVDGVSGIVTHIAKCCKPIPGDDILGFITQGKGVAIHRSNCFELKRQANFFPQKVVSVTWGSDANRATFNADIEIIAHDRHNLLRDLTDLFSQEKINIAGLRTVCKNNKAIMLFTLSIQGADFYFAGLINKIFAIHGVVQVLRK